MKRVLFSNMSSALLFLFAVLVHGAHGLEYSDLEDLGVACPPRDTCNGHNVKFQDKNCECDADCTKYNDCCIDVPSHGTSRSHSSSETDMKCMSYGRNSHTGVYVIARCNEDWTGSEQIRRKCEGPNDLIERLNAAPVTNVEEGVTYRNRYCAECNNAVMSSLKYFELNVVCEGSKDDFSQEQTLGDLTYNSILDSWGIYKLNSLGNEPKFIVCDISFDVPDTLENHVRFCRLDIISTCPPTWTRDAVKKACEEYMAVVYDNAIAYRNPHCAICNGRALDQLTCSSTAMIRRKRRHPFIRFPGFRYNDAWNDNPPKCPSGQIYDVFFKICRKLQCALPGYELVNGRCVKN